MTYRVEEVSIDGPYSDQIGQVVAEAFGGQSADGLAAIKRTTVIDGPATSRYFAAIKSDELIGFNAFIAHGLSLDSAAMPCYQSCWTATSPRHRGKRIFQTIINAAQEELRNEGAAAVIGWPNANSEPLFIHKLGYRRSQSLQRKLPSVRPGRFVALTSPPAIGIDQNDDQLIALKRRTHGDALYIHRDESGIIWGVTRKRKWRGIGIPYFDLGGIRWKSGGSARLLIGELERKLPLVAYWQIVGEKSNSMVASLGGFSASATNPFIWNPLWPDLPENYDFFGGIRDVF